MLVLWFYALVGVVVVGSFRREHHVEYILGIQRRVRILWCVAERMVHTVQNPVAARRKETRALADVRANVEEALPGLAHREHSVRAVAVQEERLAEDR